MSSVSLDYFYFKDNQILVYNFINPKVTSAGNQVLFSVPVQIAKSDRYQIKMRTLGKTQRTDNFL